MEAESTAELIPLPPETPAINLEPFVGMVFESEAVAYQLYNEYSKQAGFGIRKKLCRRSRANNDLIAGWYVCSRQGVSVQRNPEAPSRKPRGGATRIGCPAKLKVKRVAAKKWCVTEFVKDHNHELMLENDYLFRSHRMANSQEHDLVEIISRNAELREHAKDFVAEEKGMQKFLSAVDTNALHMFFMRMRSKSPTFSYSMLMDKEQRVRMAFWADAMAVVAYCHFGDVVTLDTGYLSGKFKMPLVSFVGVNHHGQPSLLGCALLADEATASYVWLFQTWLKAMSGRAPKALITQWSEYISGAVAVVFPETRHRFCLWHVLRRVIEKLSCVCRAQDRFIMKLQKCVFDSMTDEEFEECWCDFVLSFDLISDKWLQGLYEERRKWAPVYLKDTFFAGMSISSRGESLNSYFDKYVTQNTNINEFLEKYELAIESRFEDEAREDTRSFHLMPERTNQSPFGLQLSNVYTRNIFQRFQAELCGISSIFASKIKEEEESTIYSVKEYKRQDNDVNKKVKEKEYKVAWNASKRNIQCICRLFEFQGYLCRHALAVLLASSVLEIPLHYILKRWTKNAKSIHDLNVASNVRDDCSGSMAQRFNDICVQCIKLAQEASLSKKGYEAALRSLQESLERVVYENNNPRRVDQHHSQHSTGYYRASEGSQAYNPCHPMLVMPNQVGTMLVVYDPKVFQTDGKAP